MIAFVVCDDIPYEGSSNVGVFQTIGEARVFIARKESDRAFFLGDPRIERWEDGECTYWDERGQVFLR